MREGEYRLDGWFHNGKRKVGAACTRKAPSGWAGCSFHLGTDKEVFDAGAYAIYQALSIMDQRRDNGQQYTIFVDSTAAIERVRTDSIGPGQRFAAVAIEVCTRLLARTAR